MKKFDMTFYKGKRVLVTGHTGFKGAWMCRLLEMAGAYVTGYALAPAQPCLFELCRVADGMNSIEGDIRDLARLRRVFDETQPEIVIHMAAQPLVRLSYEEPAYTYETNVMGTVNVLECVRLTPSVRSFVNVTTDKVYKNREWDWGYRENEELSGYDPYSNSKSCSELVTSSYVESFFGGWPDDRTAAGSGEGAPEGKRVFPAVSTCRAGNVIGGGDFAKDRIIPDCVRAALKGEQIIVRNPYSVRPFQHVLEPVSAYLMIAARQFENPSLAGRYNIGPDESDCRTTGELVDLFCSEWNRQTALKNENAQGNSAQGNNAQGSNAQGSNAQGNSAQGSNAQGNMYHAGWINRHDGGPHEAGFLKLDCSKVKRVFGWHPVWDLSQTMEKIVEWTLAAADTEAGAGEEAFCAEGARMSMDSQIRAFQGL